MRSGRPLAPADTVRRWALDLSDEPSAAELRQMTVIAAEIVRRTGWSFVEGDDPETMHQKSQLGT